MKKASLYLSVAIFLAVLGLSWLTHGTGVITNDIARNIYIPKELTMPLQVKAAYNGRDILFRYRWPAKQPSIYHDMLKFEGGKWVRYGASVAGPQPQGIYEDRVTMLVDDGSVPEFARYGGYIAVGDRMRFFTNEAKPDEVQGASLSRPEAQADRGRQAPAGNAQQHQRLGVGGARGSSSQPCARAGTSSTSGIGARIGGIRSVPRTISTCSSCAAATPGAGPSPTTGTPRSSSLASCSTRKRPAAAR